MADSGKRDPQQSLTATQVAEYLDAKAPDFACEICGNKNWGLMTSAYAGFVLQRVHFRTFQPIGEIPIQIIECTNCGNMKFFRQQFIFENLTKIVIDDGPGGGVN